MYTVGFDKKAEKEFLELDKQTQELVANKIVDLRNGYFSEDKALQGKHKGKYRKRAGNYRIVYLRENDILLITLVGMAQWR